MTNAIIGATRTLIAGLASAVALAATLPVLLLGLPFWMISGLTGAVRWFFHRWRSDEVAWTELIEFTPEIGWKNQAGVRVRVRQARPFVVSTDGEGWRGGNSIEESKVVVFGDSFAFGHGVDDRHFFADRPSAVPIKALGVNGYNMVQELLWIERLKERLSGKLVVWFAFYGNDLLDNLHPNFRHYRTPFVRSRGTEEEWEIVTSHVRPEPWPFRPRAHGWSYTDKVAEVCCESYQSERAYSACEFLIARSRDMCKQVGARLAVIGIPDVKTLDSRRLPKLRQRSSDPDSFDHRLPDRRMMEICKRKGVLFVRLSKILTVTDHLLDDRHWTPKGHARVNWVLEKLYWESLRAPDPAAVLQARAVVHPSVSPPTDLLFGEGA